MDYFLQLNPLGPLVLSALVLIPVALFVYYDAKKQGEQRAGDWAIGTFLLAGIVFPWYQIWRLRGLIGVKCKVCGSFTPKSFMYCKKCKTAFTSLITSLIVLKCATCGNPPMFKNSQGSFVCEICDARACPRCGSQLRYDQACRESVCDKCKKKESELFTRITTELVAEQTARPTIETKQIVYCYYCGAPLPTDAVFCRKCGKSQTE